MPDKTAAAPGSRAVMTLAMGRPVYLRLACNLARSFLHWNRSSDISFHIITDLDFEPPPDLGKICVRKVDHHNFGSGFSPKLWLDTLAPADRTLFVDSDCLCFGPLDAFFERLAGQAVAVIGRTRDEGAFFGDIKALRQRLSLPWIPEFVGATYYLEKGPAAEAVYAQAREFEKQYDELGLVRLRGVPNEEPLVALALATKKILPIPDDGALKADAMHYARFNVVDVLAGHVCASQPVAGRDLPEKASPLIFHFNCHFTDGRHYKREAARLSLVARYRIPAWAATALATVAYSLPQLLQDGTKALLRPLYRRLFGARAIKRQERDTPACPIL
jgi:hypothetical protein